MALIDTIHVNELKKICEFWGFNFDEYVESFKRQYPDIEILGGDEGLQEDQEQ